MKGFHCICGCSVPIFCQSMAPVSTSIWWKGKKKVSLAFPSTCSHFSGCITCICRDGSPGRVGVSAPILKLMRAFFFFFFPATLFDSHSYKVKDKLASVLSCFHFLHSRFSVPDVLKIIWGDLTPIFPRLWNPRRLNYEHNSATFFLRLWEKHSIPLPALLV